MQLSVALASGVSVGFISNGDSITSSNLETDFIQALLDTANYFLGQSSSSLPSVVTQSYGIDETSITYPLAKYVFLSLSLFSG